MPTMKCPGCAADIEYKKGEWRTKCPYCSQWRETGEPKPQPDPEHKPPQTSVPLPKPESKPHKTGYTLEQYKLDLKAWRKSIFVIMLILAAMILYGMTGVFRDNVLEKGKLKWYMESIELAWFLAFILIGAIVRGQPDGSLVDDADLSKPHRGITLLLMLLLFIFINAAIIGFFAGWAVWLDKH